MSLWNEITARLAALSGTSTPQETRAQLNEFDVRDIQAVRVSQGGGASGPLKRVIVPIAFDTPGLTFPASGLTLYEGTPGDIYVGSYVSIPTTAWNGTTPKLNTGPPGDLGHYIAALGMDGTNSPTGDGNFTTPQGIEGGGSGVFAGTQEIFGAGDSVVALIDDGAGGDPGSTQGAGFIALFIIPAA